MNNEYTANNEAIAQAIYQGLKMLGNGNAITDMGAIEGLGMCIKEVAYANQEIANALLDVAEAIRIHTETK